jgi:hypothetical protein
MFKNEKLKGIFSCLVINGFGPGITFQILCTTTTLFSMQTDTNNTKQFIRNEKLIHKILLILVYDVEPS